MIPQARPSPGGGPTSRAAPTGPSSSSPFRRPPQAAAQGQPQPPSLRLVPTSSTATLPAALGRPDDSSPGNLRAQPGQTDRHLGISDHHLGTPDHHLGTPDHHLGTGERNLGRQIVHLGISDHRLGTPDHRLGTPDHRLGAPDHHLGTPERNSRPDRMSRQDRWISADVRLASCRGRRRQKRRAR